MRNHDKIFEDLVTTKEQKIETESDRISKQIDDIEERMTALIDKKLSALGQNNERKGDNTGTPAHIEDTDGADTGTGTDTGDNTTTDTDDTSNNI